MKIISRYIIIFLVEQLLTALLRGWVLKRIHVVRTSAWWSTFGSATSLISDPAIAESDQHAIYHQTRHPDTLIMHMHMRGAAASVRPGGKPGRDGGVHVAAQSAWHRKPMPSRSLSSISLSDSAVAHITLSTFDVLIRVAHRARLAVAVQPPANFG